MDPLRRLTPGQRYALARQLRRQNTPAERYAWRLLRNRRVLGLKFRRQHVLHGFVVDFCCLTERLVLELEGDAHDSLRRQGYDRARSGFLTAAGYRVIRVRNKDVSPKHLERVIRKALGRQSPRSPSPEGRGGQGVRTTRARGSGVRTQGRGSQEFRTRETSDSCFDRRWAQPFNSNVAEPSLISASAWAARTSIPSSEVSMLDRDPGLKPEGQPLRIDDAVEPSAPELVDSH